MTELDDGLSKAFHQLENSLRGYLRRHLADSSLADDLLQEVFVKALRYQQKGSDISQLNAWLYTVTKTTLIDHLRSNKVVLQDLPAEFADVESEDMFMHQELSGCLKPFIDQLKPIYRDTLVATDIEGNTMKKVADAQGVSVSAVKSRVVRARAQLKEILLACCHVDMEDGLVSDYHKRTSSACDDTC